jgi:uncharacterized integral membrane protein
LIDGQTEVNASNAAQIVVSRATPVPTAQQTEVQNRDGAIGSILLIGVLLVLVIVVFILIKSRNTTKI